LVVSASRSLSEMPRADVIALGLKELAEFFPVVREATVRTVVAEMQRRTGIDRIVLQSTEAGYALYRRLGFRDATRFTVYLTK
jgi:hypothetical protein